MMLPFKKRPKKESEVARALFWGEFWISKFGALRPWSASQSLSLLQGFLLHKSQQRSSWGGNAATSAWPRKCCCQVGWGFQRVPKWLPAMWPPCRSAFPHPSLHERIHLVSFSSQKSNGALSLCSNLIYFLLCKTLISAFRSFLLSPAFSLVLLITQLQQNRIW